MSAQTLKIRCPSWDHLENFYERKIKEGNVLLARVPFSPAIGSRITIALELPDGVVADIDAEVAGVREAPDGRKSAIRMILHGLDRALRSRLELAVARGRDVGTYAQPFSQAPVTVSRTTTGLPVPIPSDAPIDEVLPYVALPAIEDVPEESRKRYQALDERLRALREKATHDVLGVEWDADVETIRLAYFKMTKQYHPDVLAKYNSPAISLIASELFIYINKAYDRLRDSAVASGRAIAAGPALLPHEGWIADFEDIGTVKPRTPLRPEDLRGPTEPVLSRLSLSEPDANAGVEVQFAARQPISSSAAPAESPAPGGLSRSDLFSDARSTASGMNPLAEAVDQASRGEDTETDIAGLIAKGKSQLAAEAYDDAREVFAGILELRPRDRHARSLYHVAYGYTLLAREKMIEAMTQFEVALKHDPDCIQAKGARASVKTTRRRRPSLIERLFRR